MAALTPPTSPAVPAQPPHATNAASKPVERSGYAEQSAQHRMYTAADLAAAVGGEVRGDGTARVERLATIQDQKADRLSMTFIRSSKFVELWPNSGCGTALASRKWVPDDLEPGAGRALILVEDADEALVVVLGLFEVPRHGPTPGQHPSALIDPSAIVPATVRVGPNCVIGPGTQIGDHCVLHANITIGADVEIGPGCVLHPGVVIYDRCRIGAKSILHGNVVIGADGFGYRPDPQGRGLVKVPHIGSVDIGSMVEIGAGSCVDRGKFGATIVGDGTKIDNLVQIGHNCTIGRACVICALTGVAGSATIGDGVVIAGKVGISDNVTVGSKATITALAGVISDVPPNTVYSGFPAQPHRSFMRMHVMIRRLSEFEGVFRKLERFNAGENAKRASAPSEGDA